MGCCLKSAVVESLQICQVAQQVAKRVTGMKGVYLRHHNFVVTVTQNEALPPRASPYATKVRTIGQEFFDGNRL